MKEIIKLLKSGNFSIIYTDNGSCSIYEGKYTTDDKPEDLEPVASFDCDFHGYLPGEVALLVKALGGKADSF